MLDLKVCLICNKCERKCKIEFDLDLECPFGHNSNWNIVLHDNKKIEDEELDEDDSEYNYRFEFFNIDGEKHVRIKLLKNGKRVRSRTFKFEFLRDLFEELKEKSSVKDLIEASKNLGVKIRPSDVRLIMNFYVNNINFDAELRKIKGKTYLIKEVSKNRLKDTMSIEKSVIGTPWSSNDV